MRQIFYSIFLMLVSVLLSTLFAFWIASFWRSFNNLWLMPLVMLPSIGVATGCWLGHRLSGGADPWPVTERRAQIPFVLLGAFGCVAASYLVYIAISSVWFEASFIEMLFAPSSVKTLSETNKYGQHELSLMGNLVVGLLAGSYGTFRFIRQ